MLLDKDLLEWIHVHVPLGAAGELLVQLDDLIEHATAEEVAVINEHSGAIIANRIGRMYPVLWSRSERRGFDSKSGRYISAWHAGRLVTYLGSSSVSFWPLCHKGYHTYRTGSVESGVWIDDATPELEILRRVLGVSGGCVTLGKGWKYSWSKGRDIAPHLLRVSQPELAVEAEGDGREVLCSRCLKRLRRVWNPVRLSGERLGRAYTTRCHDVLRALHKGLLNIVGGNGVPVDPEFYIHDPLTLVDCPVGTYVEAIIFWGMPRAAIRATFAADEVDAAIAQLPEENYYTAREQEPEGEGK